MVNCGKAITDLRYEKPDDRTKLAFHNRTWVISGEIEVATIAIDEATMLEINARILYCGFN